MKKKVVLFFVVLLITVGVIVLELCVKEKEKTTDDISPRLQAMAHAICNGQYELIYQGEKVKKSAIFQCSKTREIYSVTDQNKKQGYAYTGTAYYYGTTYNEIVDKHFSDENYLYASYNVSGVPDELLIVLEANSETDLIDKYIDNLYNFIKDYANEIYEEDIMIVMFYNNQLDNIKKIPDILLLRNKYGVSYELPHGNGFDAYAFFNSKNPNDDQQTLKELIAKTDAKQIENAVNNNRHLELEFVGSKYDLEGFTKEELRNQIITAEKN